MYMYLLSYVYCGETNGGIREGYKEEEREEEEGRNGREVREKVECS